MDFLKQMYVRAHKRAAGLWIPAGGDPPVRPFKEALKGLAIIAEVKYATPKEGDLGLTQDPESLARLYTALNAAAISCLTEPEYFKGDLSYLSRIRQACPLPVLMKDFVVHERQIRAGRRFGADAVLLISEMLTLAELGRLLDFCRSLGMQALVEAHTREGLARAQDCGARMIGVNARDLTHLTLDRTRHRELVGLIPEGVVKVALSGISFRAELEAVRDMGYDAALIGRALADERLRGEVFACG